MFAKPPNLRAFWQHHHQIIIALFVLLAADLTLSTLKLLQWPIFADEAIYLRWAQVMRAEPTLRFLPLTDGKQPLFMWLSIPFLKIISDPLFAGRFLSVLAGSAGTLGLYFLGNHLFKDKVIGFLAAAAFVFAPYTFFFDRYALVDTLLCMFFIWTIYFALKNQSNPRLDLSIITGVGIGAAWLTKSPAIYLFVIIPMAFFTNWQSYSKSKWLWFRWLIACAISLGIAVVSYNILRLGPEFHQIGLRNKDYILSISEVLKNPLNVLIPNFQDLSSFYWYLITPGIAICAISGLFKVLKSRPGTALWLLLWILLPTISQLFFARTLTARYLLYTVPPILLLAAVGIRNVLQSTKYKLVTKVAVGIMALHVIIVDLLIITAPEHVPMPRRERSGYLEEWTAGQGLADIAEYLKTQTSDRSVIVGTEGFFGTTPDGLQIYFDKDPRITIIGQSHVLDTVPQGLYNALDKNQVFLVINDERFHVEDPESLGLRLIKAYPKAIRPDGTHQTLQLFEVIHQPEDNNYEQT